ncbi:MAG: YhcH/YjgK/YiaL family protein [Prevotella sp.]|nr:YhcH/YjgK/YiaL family protein [Prevotella sp.]
MIIDTIDNLAKYVEMNPLFADVVEFLKSHDLRTMEAGKHPVKGDDLYVKMEVAKQRTMETCFVESHRKMIDIQIPISCEETYGYSPLETLPEAPYDAERDMTIYEGVKPQEYVTLAPGMMVIFFPQDGHAPCIIDAPEIKKAIIKVKTK